MAVRPGNCSKVPASSAPNSTYFVNVDHGWVVGDRGTIMSTVDGGTHWRSQNSNTPNRLQHVYFVDTNQGWAVGNGGVIVNTRDGGATWKQQDSGVTIAIYSCLFC